MTKHADPVGYAVDEQTGEVHRRHAAHAAGLRRTTPGGLFNVLGDLAPSYCAECWPPAKKARRVKPPEVTTIRLDSDPVAREDAEDFQGEITRTRDDSDGGS